MMSEPTIEPAIDWKSLVPAVFARCVDPTGVRWDLSRPFVVADHLYSSNGMIAVRMPTPETWTLPNLEHPPVKSMPHIFEDNEWQADPIVIPPIDGVCGDCHGTYFQEDRQCIACKGEGSTPAYGCDCPHCEGSHECEDCDGTGGLKAGPCSTCHGSGVDRPLASVTLATDYFIARRFLAIVQQSGGIAFLPKAPKIKGVPLRFTIGDIEGVVMPMHDEGEDHW
jgi:hypothetical protein